MCNSRFVGLNMNLTIFICIFGNVCHFMIIIIYCPASLMTGNGIKYKNTDSYKSYKTAIRLPI